MTKLNERHIRSRARPHRRPPPYPVPDINRTLIRGICMRLVEDKTCPLGRMEFSLQDIDEGQYAKALSEKEILEKIAEYEKKFCSRGPVEDNISKESIDDLDRETAIALLNNLYHTGVLPFGLFGGGTQATALDQLCTEPTRLVFHLLYKNWFFTHPEEPVLAFRNVTESNNSDFCNYSMIGGGRTIVFDNWHVTVGSADDSNKVDFQYDISFEIQGSNRAGDTTLTPVKVDPKIRNDP